MNDPLILYEDIVTGAPPEADQVYQDVTKARIAQNSEVPVEKRIQYASWPETVLYFSTLTGDEKYVTEVVKEMYQFSFRRYLENWNKTDLGELPRPLDTEPGVTEYQEDRIADLRFGIKKDRDLYFVEEMYDELGVDNVPKEFWQSEQDEQFADGSADPYSQSAIDEYLD